MAAHELPRPRSLTAALLAAVLAVAAARGPARADVSYIPIPEIITDPNEGNTFGLMGVALITDEHDRVEYMIAPDIRYNKTKGVYPAFRLFGYPSATRTYTLTLAKSTTKDADYEGEFTDVGLLDGKGFFTTFAVYERDSTERFYGFGNHSSQNDESNYTSSNFHWWAMPGYIVLPNLNLNYRMRIRRFEVLRGQVDSRTVIDLVKCTEIDPNAPGCPTPVRPGSLSSHRHVPDFRPDVDGGPAVYWAHRIALTYDSRDVRDIPTSGTFSNVYVEAADRTLGSTSSFVKWGIEWRGFVPLRDAEKRIRPILALHGQFDWMSADKSTPFWEQNDLGGRRRLRGYGSQRFIDFNRSLFSAELRTRVYQRHIFGVNAELELAPFLEAGQVFEHYAQSPLNDLHWVGGLGFRGVVRPQIVGFVDIGRGSEGNAIFTGIDYPF